MSQIQEGILVGALQNVSHQLPVIQYIWARISYIKNITLSQACDFQKLDRLP